MRKRNVLNDNEWVVVVTMDETYFSKGNHQTMVETTRARHPDFQNFLDTEVLVGK